MWQGSLPIRRDNSSPGRINRLLVLACSEPWSWRREEKIPTLMGARPAQPVPLALAPPTTDTAATYQQQSVALGRVGGGVEVRGVEDGVALAQKLGLKGFSSMGRAVLA